MPSPGSSDACRATWRIALDTLDWPLMLIAQVDADATVVSPPELVDLVHASAQRMARTARPACSDAAERG